MFAVVRSTIDRKTGKQLKSEIVREVDISDDEYYKPLVEILAPKIWRRVGDKTPTSTTNDRGCIYFSAPRRRGAVYGS